MNVLGENLLEIGKTLQMHYAQLFEQTTAVKTYSLATEARKTALVPVGGWTGKNADERNADRDRTFAEDNILINLQTRLRKTEELVLEIQAKMDGVMAVRRSLEWVIRLMEATNAAN